MFEVFGTLISNWWWSFKYGWLLKAAQTDKEPYESVCLKVDGKDLIVAHIYLYSPFVDHVMGGAPGAVLLEDQQHNFIIVINEKLANCELKSREAMYAHELGHVYFGHLDKVNKWGLLTDPKYEIEADSYARRCGRAKELAIMLHRIRMQAKLPYGADKRSFYYVLDSRIKILQAIAGQQG